MNTRFTLFRRSGVFYCQDTETGQQLSLRTRDEAEARLLLHAKSESLRQPAINRRIARAYPCARNTSRHCRSPRLPFSLEFTLPPPLAPPSA
jgi:hypothetical protein